MDWDKGVCFVIASSVRAFKNVFLFFLVIGMSHKPSSERILLPCMINVSFL